MIRRPPQGELIPKAHDMWREYRVIDGLWSTAVPVAEPIAYCDDRAVAETHFYVMGKVDGRALYSGVEVADWLTVPARHRAGESFIDVLAALHMVDPATVGLDDLGRHDGYAARQLKTWHASWMSSIPASGLDDPRIHELHDWLSTSIPEQGPARVVHGDYGPHNSLFARDGELTAVLDWEIATLGEPIADLAYTINAWAEPADFPGRVGCADGPARVPEPLRADRPLRRHDRRRPDPSRLFPSAQLVEDRLHPARRVRPLRRRSEEQRGRRPAGNGRSDERSHRPGGDLRRPDSRGLTRREFFDPRSSHREMLPMTGVRVAPAACGEGAGCSGGPP